MAGPDGRRAATRRGACAWQKISLDIQTLICLGAGRPIAQVARVLGCDAMDLHLLLRAAPFAQLFRAHDDLRSLAPEARAARPYDEEPPPPPPERPAQAKPRPAADPGDRVAWRTATRLREGVMEEEAGRREAPPPPIRCDDAMLENDLALIRRLGHTRRCLPPDFLELIAADPDVSAEQKAHFRRLYAPMPDGP
jgi:hypothetical protein